MSTNDRTPRTHRRRTKAQKQEAFLEALREMGNVRYACEQADIPRRTVYEWREAEPVFAQHWEEALDEAADSLEQEAWRRAVDGVDKPVFGSRGAGLGSGEVGTVREYSDTLLILLLKAARPEKYRERTDVRQSGPVTPINWETVPRELRQRYIEGEITLDQVEREIRAGASGMGASPSR